MPVSPTISPEIGEESREIHWVICIPSSSGREGRPTSVTALEMRAIFDATLDGVVIVSNEGRYVEVNPAACRLFGLPKEQLTGCRMTDFLNPGFPFEKVWEECRKAGRSRGAIQVIQADGTLRECEFTVTANVLSGHHIVLIHDLTDRNRLEADLLQCESILRSFYDITLLPMGVVELVGDEIRMLSANDSMARYMGVRLENVPGRLISQSAPHLKNESLWVDRFRESARIRNPVHFEYFRETPTGMLTFSATACPVAGLPTSPPRFTFVVQDVTEENEAKLALSMLARIVESSNDAIIGEDLNGTITSWNGAAERLYGYRSDEAVGRPIGLIALPERLHETTDMLKRVARGEQVEEFETIRACKDGRRVDVSLRFSPIKDRTDTIVGASVVERDISTRKQAEEAVRRHNEQLTALNAFAIAILPSTLMTDLIKTLEHALAEQFGVIGGDVLLFAKRGKRLARIACWGLSEEILVQIEEQFQGQHFNASGHVLSKPGDKVARTASRGLFLELIVESDRAELRRGLCIPLPSLSGAQGVLILFRRESASPVGAENVVFEILGRNVGTAIGNARLNEKLRRGRSRMEIISRKLIEAQETERRHISRELHDEIGQNLTASKVNLQTLANHLVPSSGMESRLAESVALIDQTLQQVRSLSLNLRPSLLDDLGLVVALRSLVYRLGQSAGLGVQFKAIGLESPSMSDLKIGCYRVAQEALTNIVRHAHAKRVQVVIKWGKTHLHLMIRDDGVGFDKVQAFSRALLGDSLGLLGMQERVSLLRGRYAIRSFPNEGTVIRARFPLVASPLAK